jgi:hypothetical protein
VVEREWGYLTTERRLGQAHDIDRYVPHRPANFLGVACGDCPEPGLNTEDGYEECPPELRQDLRAFTTLPFLELFTSYLHAWHWTGDGNYISNHFSKNCDVEDVSVFEGKSLFPQDANYRQDMVKHSRALGKKVCKRTLDPYASYQNSGSAY